MTIGILLLITAVMLTNCKKDPVDPAFIVTGTTVQLQGGGEGLQFAAKCTNDDVKLTKVEIVDPLLSPATTYNLNGNVFVKNEIFGLQATNEAYFKQIGSWSFTFTGNRTSDNSSFSIKTKLSVGK